MEVMDTRELEQKETLIGKRGRSRSMGVSNDAMLMGMLSTGLYKRPLRTMIQEIMFNAWDAHAMGDCQDKPFDVYVNKQTGLIIRDYGPGIHDDDIDSIYGVYGNSTKRDDDKSTGGFGLGSKSPYAYVESFMVTSMHKDKKSMYNMVKVSEEHNGKPGIIPIIEGAPTDETGLTVTVSIKEDQHEQVREHIRDVSYLSGMKFNLHYMDEEVETIEADKLSHAEFFCSDQHRTFQTSSNIFAVYGGVSYEIEYDPDYAEDFEFLRKVARHLGSVYIGFKPNSLTPLPSREGLNMSERTKENITAALETIAEQFSSVFRPALRKTASYCFDELVATGLPEEQITMVWAKMASNNHPLMGCLYQLQAKHENSTYHRSSFRGFIFEDEDIKAKLLDACPENFFPNTWKSLIKLALTSTNEVCDFCGVDLKKLMSLIHYKKFRDTAAKDFVLKRLPTNRLLLPDSSGRGYDPNNITSRKRYQYLARQVEQNFSTFISMRDELSALTGKSLEIRAKRGGQSKMEILKNTRGAGKVDTSSMMHRQESKLKKLLLEKKIKFPNEPVPDALWSSHDGDRLLQPFLSKAVRIARTAKDVHEDAFTSNRMVTCLNQWFLSCGVDAGLANWFAHNARQVLQLTNRFNVMPVFIVPEAKGAYDKAREHLKDAGWIVYETSIHVKDAEPKLPGVVEKNPEKAKVPGFVRLAPQNHHWLDYDGTEIAKPKVYLHITDQLLHSYYHVQRDKIPSSDLAHQVMLREPDVVRLESANRESTVRKLGAISMSEWLDQEVNKILKNESRAEQLVLHSLADEQSNLPSAVLEIPEMQKALGLKYIRNRDKPKFYADMLFLELVRKERSHVLWADTHTRLSNFIVKVKNEGPNYKLLYELEKRTQVFNPVGLTKLVSKKRGENKILAEKIIRFLKTI